MIELVKVYSLTCDACAARLLLWLRTANEARAVAKYDHNWAYPKFTDLCPECAPKAAHDALDRRLAQEARGRALATELAAGWGRR